MPTYDKFRASPSAQVLYVRDLAALMGRTVAAVRGHIARGNWTAVPRPFRLGPRTLAWTRSGYEAWLAEREASAGRKRGRQRDGHGL